MKIMMKFILEILYVVDNDQKLINSKTIYIPTWYLIKKMLMESLFMNVMI